MATCAVGLASGRSKPRRVRSKQFATSARTRQAHDLTVLVVQYMRPGFGKPVF